MNRKYLSVCLAVLAVLLFCMAASAQKDTAGNVFISAGDEAASEVERDLYWAGNNRVFSGYSVGKSMVLAGRDITVSEGRIGGSLRAAGYTVLVNQAGVGDNVTAAGYSVQLSGVKAAGVYLAGNTVNFSGEADSAVLLGNSVYLDGAVHGDVLIYGSSVSFGSDLAVDGKMTVHSESEPVIPDGASFGSYEFVQSEERIEAGNDAVQVEVKKSSGGFGSFIRSLFGTLLLAALICLLLGRDELLKPGVMLFSAPLPMLGIGFAALFVIPGIILLLLFIGIGLPSAGLLAFLFALVCLHALVFTGITLANTLIPQFTDNKWLGNFWICSLTGALVFWLLRKIPVAGTIILFVSMMYSLGYFIRSIYLRLRGPVSGGKKGSLAEKADAPVSKDDALEPVKKASPDEYVDPVLAESEELFAVREEPVQTAEEPAAELQNEVTEAKTDVSEDGPKA